MTKIRHISVADLFRKPQRSAVLISPEGTYVGWLEPWKRRLNVHVRNLRTGAEWRVTNTESRDVLRWFWASDSRLVFVQDAGGDENYRLFAVAADRSEAIDLTPFEGVRCTLVDELLDEPDQILFQMNRRDPKIYDVYRANVVTGDIQLVAINPGNVRMWITDWTGKVRAAMAGDGLSDSLLYRDDENDGWSTIRTFDFTETFHPLCFTSDDRRLLLASNVNRDKIAIFEFDPANDAYHKLIFEHPDVDVTRIASSQRRRTVTQIMYETDRQQNHFLDQERCSQQLYIDTELPGRINSLISHSRDETLWIVQSSNDRTLGGYYFHTWEHQGAVRSLKKLFDVNPLLEEDELASMQPITFTSRDGLTIHGYLTLPIGAEARDLPLLLYPHGGPWLRDSWRFDPVVQLLANRGVAVLQVNFRGSTGYGKAFWRASFGQWGLAMQDDLTDAVHWVVNRGIANPARIAIYGASYGGYATLTGVTKEPELFACAVDYCGISNIFTWLEAFPPYWEPGRAMAYSMIGDPDLDAVRLKETSPLFHVDRIRCPLLVAQGANDPRVRKGESDQIVSALRERGMDVQYIIKQDEGHGFRNEENQFEFYRAMEQFLARHLGLESDEKEL